MKKRKGGRKTGKGARAALRSNASRRRRQGAAGAVTATTGGEEPAAPDFELGDEAETPQYPRLRPVLPKKNPLERTDDEGTGEEEDTPPDAGKTGAATAGEAKKFVPKIPLRFHRDIEETDDAENLLESILDDLEDDDEDDDDGGGNALERGGDGEGKAGAGLAPSIGVVREPLISTGAKAGKAKPEGKPAEKRAEKAQPVKPQPVKTEPVKAQPGPGVSSAAVAPKAAPGVKPDAAPRFVEAVAVGPRRGAGRGLAIVTALAVFLAVPAAIFYLANANRELREKLAGLEAALEAMAERAAAAAGAPAAAAAEATVAKAVPDPVAEAKEPPAAEGIEGAGGIRAQVASVELRLENIEKRVKLANYADEAISSGSRYAFGQLEKAYEDPAMLDLTAAANAEISRVEAFFLATAGARYQAIPVQMVDANLQSDKDLNVEQLAQLILSSTVPPLGRARSAELLGMHPSLEACDLLVEVIRTEPNLVVLLEATRSFKKLTGYPSGEVFGGRELERWFGEHRDRIAGRMKSKASG